MKRSLVIAGAAALAGMFVTAQAKADPSIAYIYIVGADASGAPALNGSGTYDSWRSAPPSNNIDGFSLVPTGIQMIPSPSAPVPLAVGTDIYAMTSASFTPATPDPSYAIDIYFSESGVVDSAHPLQAYIGSTGSRVAEPATNTITSPLYGPMAGNGSLTYSDMVDGVKVRLASFSWATQTVSGQTQQVGGLSFSVVPEPASYLLLGVGLAGLGLAWRRGGAVRTA